MKRKFYIPWVLRHILVWLVHDLHYFKIQYTVTTSYALEIIHLFYLVTVKVAFYGIYLLAIPAFSNKKYISAIVYTFLTISSYYFLIIISYKTSSNSELNKTVITDIAFYYFGDFFKYGLYAFGLYVYHAGIRYEKEKRTRQKQRFDNEFYFLENQLNQHFFYNLLNFFYTKARKHSKQLSESFMWLSDILRYSINTNYTDDAPLDEEIEAIENLINLANYRFNDTIGSIVAKEVDFSIYVIPHLFIFTLVQQVVDDYSYRDIFSKIIFDLNPDFDELTINFVYRIPPTSEMNAKVSEMLSKAPDSLFIRQNHGNSNLSLSIQPLRKQKNYVEMHHH